MSTLDLLCLLISEKDPQIDFISLKDDESF